MKQHTEKRRYEKPAMRVYELQHRGTILNGSPGGPQGYDQPGAPLQF